MDIGLDDKVGPREIDGTHYTTPEKGSPQVEYHKFVCGIMSILPPMIFIDNSQHVHDIKAIPRISLYFTFWFVNS